MFQSRKLNEYKKRININSNTSERLEEAKYLFVNFKVDKGFKLPVPILFNKVSFPFLN